MTKQLKKNPALFRRFTGLTIDKFDRLLLDLYPIYKKNENRHLTKKYCRRAIGGGSQFTDDLEDRALMLLLYYRLYITHQFMSYF